MFLNLAGRVDKAPEKKGILAADVMLGPAFVCTRESPLSSTPGPSSGQTQPLYRGLPPNKNVQSHSFKMLQAALGEGRLKGQKVG